MADRFLFTCGLPGVPGNNDTFAHTLRDTLAIRNHAPIGWTALCDQPAVPVLFTAQEDLDMEQKKAALGQPSMLVSVT